MAIRNIAYGTDIDLTLALASLATHAGLLIGRASTAVVNTSTLAIDYLIGGKITTGTSPTASKSIEVWVYAAFDDGPTYPDSITGTDAGKTMTSTDIKVTALALAAVLPTDNTSNRTYNFAGISLASLFGGRCPAAFGVFVVHDTGVALHATAGNHQISARPITETIA